MSPSREELLRKICNHVHETGEPLSFYCNAEDCDPSQLVTPQLERDINYLIEAGYIRDELDIINSYHLIPTGNGEDYIQSIDSPAQNSAQSQSTVFNFNAPVSGNAIIGTQENATQNVNYTLSDLENVFAQRPVQEQQQLSEILDLLRKITAEDLPVTRSTFNRVAEFLKKHVELKFPIAITLFNHLLG